MYVILPTGEYALRLCGNINRELKKENISYTPAEVLTLIDKMVEDLFFSRLYWVENKESIDAALKDFFPWWLLPDDVKTKEQKQVSDYCLQFWFNIIEPIYNEVDCLLLEHLTFACEEDHWRVWYKRYFNNDIVLERGTDFRILDWHRMTKKGNKNELLV